jgi:hypothetical protein
MPAAKPRSWCTGASPVLVDMGNPLIVDMGNPVSTKLMESYDIYLRIEHDTFEGSAISPDPV